MSRSLQHPCHVSLVQCLGHIFGTYFPGFQILVSLANLRGKGGLLTCYHVFYTSMGLYWISGELLDSWQSIVQYFAKIHQVINLDPSSQTALSFQLRVST